MTKKLSEYTWAGNNHTAYVVVDENKKNAMKYFYDSYVSNAVFATSEQQENFVANFIEEGFNGLDVDEMNELPKTLELQESYGNTSYNEIKVELEQKAGDLLGTYQVTKVYINGREQK